MRLSLDEFWQLCVDILIASNTTRANAEHVANALAAAEADGLRSHGAARLPAYAAQVRSGKIAGKAVPRVKRTADAALHIDARHGFAYPALAVAVERLGRLAQRTGIAAAAVSRSHHFGVGGYHVERLAAKGVIGLLFGNSPQAIAPWGGNKPLFGTNPIAFAAPRRGAPPLVIDLSLSKVARGKIMVAAQRGETIPDDWALDSAGQPTTDPRKALKGAMLPVGDAKGYALVLMVEILAAALCNANFGFEASSFFDAEGAPPGVGQFMIGIAPGAFSQHRFERRLATLCEAIAAQPGARLPGERRLHLRRQAEREGIELNPELAQQVTALLARRSARQA